MHDLSSHHTSRLAGLIVPEYLEVADATLFEFAGDEAEKFRAM